MSQLGNVALVLALAASIFSIAAFIFGLRSGRRQLIDVAKKGVLAAAAFFSISVIGLLVALITHDFQIEYVYSYSSSGLSLPYLISALWAGNAGSLLFWGWIVSLAAAAVVWKKRPQGEEGLVPSATAVIMVVQLFFIILLLFVPNQNPFKELTSVPVEGAGLNPLLENPGMIVHPPLLLAGYALFVVPFAFAIAALLTRRHNDGWLVAIRGWALWAWLLLGLGNLIGAWWAYVELSFGGYWAWDPVENAGLMPWLMVTAFLHAALMQRRKGIFKLWSMLLVITAFTLTIFGTFLTRSDILSSVHTFGQTAVGPFFLGFLIISFFGSLGLLFYRRRDLEGETDVDSVISSEGTFLGVNLLLVGATFVIFLGTIFPSLSELFGGGRVSVDASYFNMAAVPIFLAIILLSGVCVLIGWRRLPLARLGRQLFWPSFVAMIVAIALLIFGVRQGVAVFVYSLSALVVSAIVSVWLRDLGVRWKRKHGSYFKEFFELILANRGRYGGFMVHLSLVVMAIGIAGSSLFDVKKEAVLAAGESMTVGEYQLTYQDRIPEGGSDKMTFIVIVEVFRGGKSLGIIKPKIQFYSAREQWIPRVAIRSTPAEDLWVVPISWDSEVTAIEFRALVSPLIVWIWVGGGFFLLGGLIALWPGRRPAHQRAS
jgi:cytochrome c-type biogenesis protein CcmF